MEVIKRMDFRNPSSTKQNFEILEIDAFLDKRSFDHIHQVTRVNFYILMYITSGTGQHEVDFKKYDLKKGDIILISKNQVHRFIKESKTKGFILFFTKEFLFNRIDVNIQHFINQFNAPMNHPVVNMNVEVNQTNRILIELLHKEYQLDTNNGELVEMLFRSFILTFDKSNLIDNKKKYSQVYERFIEFKDLVEANYKTKKTVQEYAQLMLVTQKTINKATRAVTDLSAKQFIIDRIILEIKRYLCQGELTINEISDLMGFDEPSNFTKFFKRYVDVSPNEFKRKYYN